MMQIGSTLPAHSLQVFQARRAVFECSGSPLNPLNRSSARRPPESFSTEATKKHLSNLERLLQKQSHPNNPPPPDPKNEPGLDGETRTAGSILEGLSLARVWPEMKAAEEMSPRHLNRLQRLLSKSAEYSPRSSLGSRWREYHGSNDWAGMLDPLDENLRREVVRYGEFIQAAYHGFHSQPATSADEALRPPRRVALPDRSYRVTRSLYATASVGLPKWVDDVAPDLGWMTQRSSWVGYVAVCDDPREIQRMGRRDIVIALRGTATCLEWAENIRNVLIPIPSTNNKTTTDAHEGAVALTQQQPPKVECGFLSLLKTRGEHVPSLAESAVLEIQRLMEKYKGETLSITITGHSLGAALALLVGHELSTCIPNAPPVAVFSFGGPRVGNRGFASRLEANKVKVLRIVNSQDLVTRVPGMFVNEEIDTKLRAVGGGRKLLEAIDRSLLPWAYTHVGTELRVDTKMSPFLRPDADVACCHDLEAYLHLVDGFLASNCPFRPNAKRSLWRLLNEQRSNVKRLYTSKAKALTLNNVKRSGTAMSNCLPSPS